MGLFPCVSHLIYTHKLHYTHTHIEKGGGEEEERELGESSTQAIGSHWKPIKLKER